MHPLYALLPLLLLGLYLVCFGFFTPKVIGDLPVVALFDLDKESRVLFFFIVFYNGGFTEVEPDFFADGWLPF